MSTEAEQAKQVIDVFGEAYMQLVRERLRLHISTFVPQQGKVQITIGLIDNAYASRNVNEPNTGQYMIDSQTITLELTTQFSAK